MTKTTLSALLLLASAAQAAVTFTEKPVAARKGDAFTVTFTVSAKTDVAVYIEDSAGKAVRHLAAGIVGNPIDAFAVGPQGRVYAFHKNEGLVHWWSHNITILDRDGKHFKTIWPYPADIDLERIKALAPFRTKEGDLVSHIYHGRKFSFYPEVDIIGLGRHAGYTCPAVGPDGRVYWMAHGLRLGCLAADGSAPYDPFAASEEDTHVQAHK